VDEAAITITIKIITSKTVVPSVINAFILVFPLLFLLLLLYFYYYYSTAKYILPAENYTIWDSLRTHMTNSKNAKKWKLRYMKDRRGAR
jgi:hypothetical protein